MRLCCWRVATTKSWLVSGFQKGSITGASERAPTAGAPGVEGLPSMPPRPVPSVGIASIRFISATRRLGLMLNDPAPALDDELGAPPGDCPEGLEFPRSCELMLGVVIVTTSR